MSVDNVQVTTPVSKRRRLWSPNSKEHLSELLSNYTLDQVAEKLHRTKTAVIVKAKRLGISKNIRDGWYTEQEVASILGMDPKTVGQRIQTGTLVAAPRDSDRLPRKGKSAPWLITRKALRDYIRKFPEDLQGRSIDMIVVVDILAGVKA